MFLLLLLYFGIILARVIDSVDKLSHYNNIQLSHDEKYICHTSACHEYDQNIQHSMNKVVDPCFDFYNYSCGNWERNNPIMTNQKMWSTFVKIKYNIYHYIHELLEKKNGYDKIPFIKIAKQYHRSCLNEDAIETEGLKPMKLILNTTGGWPILMSNTKWKEKNYRWQNINNIHLGLYNLNNFFGVTYMQDAQNQDRNILMIHQFLSYPLKEKYKYQYFYIYEKSIIEVVLALAIDEGIQIPMTKLRADVAEIIQFEMKLRKISGHIKKLKFPEETIRMTIAELQEFYNGDGIQKSSTKINWLKTIQFIFNNVNISINASEPVLISKHHSLRQLASLLRDTPRRVIVNYMQWNIVSKLMQFLNRYLRNIEFQYRYLSHDMPKQDPRWLTCMQTFLMKDIMSYLFIKTHASGDNMKAVLKMVDEIKTELKERISFSWMNNNTKINITNKIDNILPLIGYPKKYDNLTILIERYKGMNIGKNYFKNWLEITKFEIKRTWVNFRKEVLVRKNRTEWPFNPMRVNAFYLNSENLIVIPITLLQNVYFASNTPLAIRYATIGFIIAHELSHSFTRNVFSRNQERSNCIVQQYNNFTLGITDKDGESSQNGDKVLNEVIADFIGIQAAFAVFQKRKMKEKQMKLSTFVNITDEKLFFLSFVNQFCESPRELGTDLDSDKRHGFTNFRIMTSLANVVSFSEAFNCPVGSLMNPKLKCKIWH